MASNVTADEARAIARALSGAAGDESKLAHVEPRQFERPLRLSALELDAVRDKLKKSTGDVARELASSMRSRPRVELIELSEVNADTITHDLRVPFAALRFEVDKQPGWLVWDIDAALATLDVALGAAEPTLGGARPFTSIERSMFVRLLTGSATRLSKALGLVASSFSVAQDLDSFGSWRQGGDKSETQRLMAVFELEALGKTSRWRLYLPGVVPSARSTTKPGPAAPLPHHLGDVTVEVRAHLGANDVPLAELLALEVGDVIALNMPVGEPLRVLVENQACLRAVLGRSQGKLAVRITQIERPKSDT